MISVNNVMQNRDSGGRKSYYVCLYCGHADVYLQIFSFLK